MDILHTIVFALLAFFLSGYEEMGVATPPVGTTSAEVVRVIDGDTIDVRIASSSEIQRIRYIGINTPEPYRDAELACFSTEATARNKELVVGQTVALIPDVEEADTYDRLLRYVYVGDTMVNAALVQEGFATTLPIKPNTRFAAYFAQLQEEAMSDKRGLWSACR